MFYCSYCKEYIGITSIYEYCSFCSNLSRVIKLYSKKTINEILMKHLNGLNLLPETDIKKVEFILGDDKETKKEIEEETKKEIQEETTNPNMNLLKYEMSRNSKKSAFINRK